MLEFFKDERVLVLQDLGEWMQPLDCWMYLPTSTTESPPSLETCGSVGTRLGRFLASVHCNTTLLSESQKLTDDGKLWFENPDTKDLTRDKIMGRVLPILQPWNDIETGRTEKIAKLISQDFERSFLDVLYSPSSPSFGVPQSMFSMGDLWTGSIIVGAPPTAPSPNPSSDALAEVNIGLIDWEFAAPTRIGQDITQLTCWLYLFSTLSAWSSAEPRCRRMAVGAVANPQMPSTAASQFGPDVGAGARHGIGVGAGGGANPVTSGTPGVQSAARTLLNALLNAYARKVKEHPDYAWFVDEDHDQRRYKRERLAVIRSIWILFGREVIFDSVEGRDWFVKCCARGVDGGEKEEEIRLWQREMIEVGFWYVSVAGESTDEAFEEAVRKECVLKRMYTASGSL